MKKRVLITGAALAQSLVLAALTLNPGVASATAYGPTISNVDTGCTAFSVGADADSFSISGTVSWGGDSSSAWCKNVPGSGERINGSTLTLVETILWDSLVTTSSWWDWHEKIDEESESWSFLSGTMTAAGTTSVSSDGSTFDALFDSAQTNVTFTKTVKCMTTNNSCGDLLIHEWPTVGRNPIPEPGTLLLLGAGLIGIAGRRFARR